MPQGWVKGEGTISAVLPFDGRAGRDYSIVFAYTVYARAYSGRFSTADVFARGQTIYFTYNPDNPAENSLSRSESRKWWLLGGMILLVLLGAVLLGIYLS